jgi:ankyrin repeat protein
MQKDYKKAIMLVEEDEVHPDAHDKGENTLLAEAAKRGDLAAICFAIDQLGASTDTSCDCPLHKTPLHYAAEKRHVTVVRALLERGATPNLINSLGETPLDLATDKNVRDLLEAHGAISNKSLQAKTGFFERFFRKIFGYKSEERTLLYAAKKTKAIPSKEGPRLNK